MKIPDFLEGFVVKMAISRSGPLVMKTTTGIVAATVAFLAQKVPGLEVYLNEYVLTGILWLIIPNIQNPRGLEIFYRFRLAPSNKTSWCIIGGFTSNCPWNC
jgi:hypothetical protein